MNKTTRITLRIGILLLVLVVLAAPPAMAQNTVYFDPDPSCAAPGETTTVTMWLNSSDGCTGFDADIYFDPSVVDISGTAGDFPYMFTCSHKGTFVRVGGMTDDAEDLPAGNWKLAVFTLEANATCSGTSALEHDAAHHGLYNSWMDDLPNQTWIDGTFESTETFEKELVEGWNLISLPLTPKDSNSTDAVLSSMSGKYDAVYKYNAETDKFESVTTGTVEPGIGYFVNVTTADTWSYEGTAYASMTVDLKQGLNLVGWTSTNTSLPDALNSIAGKYNYVAQWDTTSGYEVYDANAPDGVSEFIDFTTMERGSGYWIVAKEGYTLNV